jgi:hypothetical protein
MSRKDHNMKPGDLVRIRPYALATDGRGPVETNGEVGVFVRIRTSASALVLVGDRFFYLLQQDLELINEAG